MLRVMVCSQKTCSGHCTTALFRMRFMAYWRPEVSSAHIMHMSDATQHHHKQMLNSRAPCHSAPLHGLALGHERARGKA